MYASSLEVEWLNEELKERIAEKGSKIIALEEMLDEYDIRDFIKGHLRYDDCELLASPKDFRVWIVLDADADENFSAAWERRQRVVPSRINALFEMLYDATPLGDDTWRTSYGVIKINDVYFIDL